MVDYLPRSAWGARPPTPGPGDLTRSRVAGVAIHWPGTKRTEPFETRAEVAAALRGWQAFHMDTKGWSDIAYQVAVDQAGRAWTLRGLSTQSGANGDVDVNERYGAILLILVAGEEPSAAMKATVRDVVADYRTLYLNCVSIRPHSAIRPDPTDCPGPAARAAIARGDFTPTHHPEDDDMWNPEQAELIEKRYTLAHQLWLSQTYAERAVSDALAVRLVNGEAAPPQATIDEAVATVERIWRPVQEVQAEGLRRLG